MKEQNLSNHTRYVPVWHFLVAPVILCLLIGAFINLANAAEDNLYSASLICLISVIFCFIYWYVRAFALKAQDRAIRGRGTISTFYSYRQTLAQRTKAKTNYCAYALLLMKNFRH